GAAGSHEPTVHRLGVTGQVRHSDHEQYLNPGPFPLQQACDHEPVPSVMTLTAKNRHSLAGQGAEYLFHGGDDTGAGMVHQGEAWDVDLCDGPELSFMLLRCCIYPHNISID